MMTYFSVMSSHPDQTGRRSGRRPGESGTREAILAAARHQFAEHGYARASLRGIAAEAGVDQKLIAHFFGSKQQLFLAAVGLPANPNEILTGVLQGGDPHIVTERLATILTRILDQPELFQPLAAVIRASATEPDVRDMLREFFPGALLPALAGLLGPGDPGLRLNLFGSQVAGVILVRDVIGVDPIASTPAHAIAGAVAPTLTRYLLGPLNSQSAT
jgi:AcrR family transcriptional regulator